MLPVLHITSKEVSNKKFFYLGSSKDINSRIEYFDKQNFLVDRIEVHMNFNDVRKEYNI